MGIKGNNLFEEYVDKATKAFADAIKGYPIKPYRHLALMANFPGEFGRFDLGMTEREEDDYWESIDCDYELEDSFIDRFGWDEITDKYHWLRCEDDEGYSVEENEENCRLLNSYFEWHALAQVVINLLSDLSLQAYLSQVNTFHIEASDLESPKFNHYLPSIDERKCLISELVNNPLYQDRLLDGWGDSLQGEIINPFLSRLIGSEHMKSINQMNLVKLSSTTQIPHDVEMKFKNFIDNHASVESFRKTFGEKLSDGKWSGFWSTRLGSGWIGYYQVNDDESITVGGFEKGSN
jgi:hypothetical protein